ncbi:PTS sugar transporter subunit IIB [Spiroplasma endosymbiont of Aspidapion aeneum]|uniref:PTS sugar transporter subunit IIB n=1 Tax=Spiroplasma endosymbiont of Aspidapion aeneum TaxID=3066276 RepID=UPI00313BA659
MKKILLACGAGLSTSMMVESMKVAAKEINLELEIWAEPVSTAISKVNDVDYILLGPQVRYELNRFLQSSNNTPVEVIDMKDYGMMDGKSVIMKLKDKL